MADNPWRYVRLKPKEIYVLLTAARYYAGTKQPLPQSRLHLESAIGALVRTMEKYQPGAWQPREIRRESYD